MEDCYKIKLRSVGYRLVYQVRENEIVVSVVSVGKREKMLLIKRLQSAFDGLFPLTLG